MNRMFSLPDNMLSCPAHGLGTRIMGYTVIWPDIHRELLGIPKGKPVATSIALGYPDADASNQHLSRLS